MTRLCPLFSGSSGNSYYIGSASDGILIDCGRSAKQIVCALEDNRLDIKNVRAVFVTHEHIDHSSALRVLASKYKLKVYASEGTINALESMTAVRDSDLRLTAATAGALHLQRIRELSQMR